MTTTAAAGEEEMAAALRKLADEVEAGNTSFHNMWLEGMSIVSDEPARFMIEAEVIPDDPQSIDMMEVL